jgi:hypothetical protein
MSWRYYITDNNNKTIKSDGGFQTEDDAQSAATAYLVKAAPSMGAPVTPVYTITTGEE